MYNETYEDYIRSILGYPNYGNTYQNNPNSYRNNEQNLELEACYPEIYKVVYPMVNKACTNNTRVVNSALIDELADEIYQALENDNEIRVNINLNNEVGSVTVNQTNTNSHNDNKNATQRENRGEDRQVFRNRGLQDLIRILLIRELLGRPGNRPPMPPHRPPMRPPFPGGPGPRPPIMPRGMDLYEY